MSVVEFLKDAKKAVGALIAGVAVAVTGGLITGSAAVLLTTGLASVLAAITTYSLTNEPAPTLGGSKL